MIGNLAKKLVIELLSNHSLELLVGISDLKPTVDK